MCLIPPSINIVSKFIFHSGTSVYKNSQGLRPGSINNGEHLYSAFPHSSKRFDPHYYPERPGINLKPSQLPWKYTVQLPVRRSD